MPVSSPKNRGGSKVTGPDETGYRISSYCGGSGCVAVQLGGEVRIRDSKQASGPELVFDAGEWTAFVAGVKAGEFDL
ncbi:DUF397 domain-containing protein [Spongisporangium articulatum]|uniref:DUF397 domain-containing protein n=1 Tax=Spongisporangium articulatum TaxID=3362603 RepID=A0ABW8ALH4_9ACTN